MKNGIELVCLQVLEKRQKLNVDTIVDTISGALINCICMPIYTHIFVV